MLDFSGVNLVYIGIGAGVLALLMAWINSRRVEQFKITNPRVEELTQAIREGSMAFLNAEYRILVLFVISVAILLALFMPNQLIAMTFVLGAMTSAVAGNIGMRIATRANGRTATAAQEGGLARALDVAFSGGAVMGMAVAGLGLLGISLLLVSFNEGISIITGFGMGASSIALFARVAAVFIPKQQMLVQILSVKLKLVFPKMTPETLQPLLIMWVIMSVM